MPELNFTPFPVLTTDRLALRKLTMEDAPDVFILRSHPVVQKFIRKAPAQSVGEAEEWIAKMLRQEEKNETINWGITLKGSNRMIGSICLWNIDREENIAEVGYSLHPDYYRQGIMNKALSIVTDYGFDMMKLQSINAFTNKNNIASLRLLEKNSFKRDFEFEKRYSNKDELEYNVIYSRS